jgi:hypothetical protein
MKDFKILILEDDLETVSFIFSILDEIKHEENVSFAATVLPDYIQTDRFINKNPKINFDILLLDRDCYLGGSFHTVNLKRFDLEKVISISSVPEYNKKAQEMGIKKVVLKDFSDLRSFADKLKEEIKAII